MQQKKVPMRMCVGCGKRRNKNEFIRVVRTPEGEICLDFKGKMNGRGTYICKNEECLQKAIKAKRLENALSTQIPQEIYDKLKKELSDAEQ